MNGLRATVRAPGLELRLRRRTTRAGKRLDLLDLTAILERCGEVRITARLKLQGRREGDLLELPLGGVAAASALPDRGELTVEAEVVLRDGVPVLERLEARCEPGAVRFVVEEDDAPDPLIAGLAGTTVQGLRLEPGEGDRGVLAIEGDVGDAALSIEISRRLDGRWLPAPIGSVLAALGGLVDGGSVEAIAGEVGSLAVTLQGPAAARDGDGELPLPPLTADLTLSAGSYGLGAIDLPDLRGPLRLQARLGPSSLPREGVSGRAEGRIDCSDLEVDGVLGFGGAEVRAALRGRGRLLVSRSFERFTIGLSGVVLRSEGLRIGLEGRPGRDLRLDVTASPLSATIGWMGAELAMAAERLVAPACVVGPGGLRLDQASRCEQLRVSFRSPLESGGVSASGAAAMEELEARGEFGRGVAEIEPLRVRGLRPSLSLAFERAGSAAEAALTLGGLLAGHTSLEGLLRITADGFLLSARAGAEDEGVRLEAGEIELTSPGHAVRLVAETGPIQPERLEVRRGSEGVVASLRLGRTLVGLREIASEVAGAEGSFRGEATGELSGLEFLAERGRYRVSSAGSGLAMRLLGEGVLQMGGTTIRLDRERATTVRLRGELTREPEGRVALQIDGGEVQARIGRSEHVRDGS